MRWSGATGAIARCKNRSIGYVRKPRSAPAWRWTCGEKPKGQGVAKPSTPYMRHGLPKATRSPRYSLDVIVSCEIARKWHLKGLDVLVTPIFLDRGECHMQYRQRRNVADMQPIEGKPQPYTDKTAQGEACHIDQKP